ncbi:MAG: glutamyl-tRNA amidotransferase [Acidithiobacillales bacterium SM23_46]|jgi:Asp-tRNA(Asn)/Glu-tRNA(Gln) amidotransferase A subunit family amidase|nr:MAG: glutamyl-tRNA amidotransferase [Thiotrichales bacterium SG8_50]KPK71423.1 MAG: glutamyl-tRNA amidotransferase [Acidithiobacillales bacterium SM23_46]KPL27180.1 MAG: glutamyl-tRNA amidotransferase [Acidithiobacillales bacterium SM1_46]
MDASQLYWLSAADAARAIHDGTMGSEQLMENCLARVGEVEDQVQAWQFLDPEYALNQARARDEDRSKGQPVGLLHGVPVGIKDIIDTEDMPTEDGTVLHAGRTPAHDATVVSMLRAAGAVIMGKTVTTECATYTPGKTRNPHNPEHTPGGSSSGSAAAVAAGMVPLALGSQTNGSVIRPAAYCGVYGFKPTHGLISRHGVLRLSRTLDQMGVFARTIEDIALACEVLVGHDERDPDTRPRARVPFRDIAAGEPPLPPTIALIKTPLWERTDEDTREAFAELVEVLGDRVVEVNLPGSALNALELHRTIMEAEMAAALVDEYDRGRDQLSDALRAQLERGRAITALEYQAALARIPLLNEGFDELFERCDAVLTPAVAGTAPKGLTSTGDPSFCTLWSLCGMPALALPLLHGANGLPLGVQLVGQRHRDARLLRTARWLTAQVADD